MDIVVTTNFDYLIEQSLPKLFIPPLPWKTTRVWKIHGDVRKPRTVATTIRRIGQAAFDEKLVNKLKRLLQGSHVIFIGYSGADPDLMPAFKTARMASVFWCVHKPEQLDPEKQTNIIYKDPCKTILANGTQIKWIVGDLQKDLLMPIEVVLSIKAKLPLIPTRDLLELNDLSSPLSKSMKWWRHDEAQQLSRLEKARAILRILYYIALCSSNPESAWILLIETTDAMAEDRSLSNYVYSEFRRDLHAFQAEAYCELGFLAQQVDNVATRLSESSLKISGSTLENQVGQLFIRAKDHLTDILSLQFEDAVQVQFLLTASKILTSLANSRSAEGKTRNIQDADEMLKKGFKICNKAKINSEKRNILKARCYSNLAVLREAQGEFEKSLLFWGNAERLFRRSGDFYNYIDTSFNISLLLINLNRLEEAERYYKEARNMLDSFPNIRLEGKAEKLRKLLHEIQDQE